LRVILRALEHPDFVPLLREQAPEATRAQLLLAHTAEHVDAVLALGESGESRPLDPDTVVGPGSVTAARLAAGGVIAAVDAVMEGWADSAFAAVRPPGHHAEATHAMGFCLFNSAAIAAFHAQQKWGLKKVPWLISMCITATAPSTCSPRTPICSISPATRCPATPAPAPPRRQGWPTTSSTCH
jgi:acetoin utilization deacetylase AcuC-like enzyme